MLRRHCARRSLLPVQRVNKGTMHDERYAFTHARSHATTPYVGYGAIVLAGHCHQFCALIYTHTSTTTQLFRHGSLQKALISLYM